MVWEELKNAVMQGAKAYLAVDLAFRKSGLAVVLMPGPHVHWTGLLVARPISPKKVTDLVIQQRLRSLFEQTKELGFSELVPLLSGVFAETPEQFQSYLSRKRKGSSYAAVIATGMAKSFLILVMQHYGFSGEIVFADPGKVENYLGVPVSVEVVRSRIGAEVADLAAKSMSEAKLRRRIAVWLMTEDDKWWAVEGGKFVRSHDESDAAALGIVGARLAMWDRVEELRVSWRR